MPRDRWHGYIKDYDGGTLMECVINQSINYVHIRRQIEEQRRIILERINAAASSATVYAPLGSHGDGKIRDIFAVPGVRACSHASPRLWRAVRASAGGRR